MKNWRTFLVGMIGAAYTACLPLIQHGSFDIKTDYPSLIQAAGIAVFSYLVKDAKVSGKP
jgi:hypothetical protein